MIYSIDTAKLKNYNINEALKYYETRDYTDLKLVSNTDDEKLINTTLWLNNHQKGHNFGFVYHESAELKNTVGYIKNLKFKKYTAEFDLVFLNTHYGKLYSNINPVGFDITFRKTIFSLNTNGSYINGAVLSTDSKAIAVFEFLVNTTGVDSLKLLEI